MAISEPFAINAVDAAMAYADDNASRWIVMLGQGCHRRALMPIFDAHRSAPSLLVERLVVAVVRCIRLVSIATANGNTLDDERAADLAAFFIQRARFMRVYGDD